MTWAPSWALAWAPAWTAALAAVSAPSVTLKMYTVGTGLEAG